MRKVLALLLLCSTGIVQGQNQINWGPVINIASPINGNNHPRIVTDASGNPLVIWGNSKKVIFSRWNGANFSTPVALNPGTIQIAEASWMGPDIASHGDTVYVVFK